MLQKFNITTYAVVLCLFGFMLFTAAPVFADPQGEFDDCKEMEKGKGKNRLKKLLCFRDLAEELLEINENLRTVSSNDASSSDSQNSGMCVVLDALREHGARFESTPGGYEVTFDENNYDVKIIDGNGECDY